MPFIDDIYLKNLLSTSLQNFRNELITHKVSKINCNFIDFIINKSPTNISYLNEYYKYFNQIDISGLGYSKIKNKFIVSGKVNNFYLADPISKASPTMTKCSKQLLVKSPFLM